MDEPLSSRDRAVCDGFLAGLTTKTLGEQHDLTPRRVGQILHQPNAVAYLLGQAGGTRALLFAKVGAVLLDRAERDELKIADLIALWKAAMPQESTVTVTVLIRREAERLAAAMGLDPAEVLAEAEAIVGGVSA